ncbi:MAG: AmmeMemoRadiSam system protein B, partial [Candidatus Syntrophosphaera sp.]|nr:AmmeMemoRadiSam system protein B [Candidatus Syntrophosphaera sp.]
MLRKTTHAGSFYPRFGEQISAQIEKWTAGQTQAPPGDDCLGLIVPHAGYVYSGECAARGFHHISGQQFDTLVILHPSHHGIHFDWSVSSFEQYDTPLGKLDLDVRLFELLTKSGTGADKELRLHEAEHSLEVQLPFIKHFFPEALICPIMIGRPYPEVASQLAEKLREAIKASGKRVGIIVSTDLSHYYNADKAEKMDALITKYLMSLDADGLWQSVIGKRCEACGIGGLLTLLLYAGAYDNARARIIHYTHSGKVTGDNQQVVG